MTSCELFPRLNQKSSSFSDDRGAVNILYESEQAVLKRSSSKKGVLRGLHRQVSPALQVKIIRIVSGSIIDFVANPEDPNELIWYAEISPKDEWVRIDSHLAHGFYAIEDVVFEYFCDGRYDESLEESYRIDGIVKKELGLRDMILSEKDLTGRLFGKSLRPFRGTS